MTYPRAALVAPETTPYYHCVSRCVRRALLCGVDRLTGRDFEHRKQWIVERLAQLSEVFTIDVCAYAVMSNHHHLVLRIDAAAARALSEDAVAERWGKLFELPAWWMPGSDQRNRLNDHALSTSFTPLSRLRTAISGVKRPPLAPTKCAVRMHRRL